MPHCAVGGQKGADARGLGARHGCGGQAGDRRICPFRMAAKRAARAGTVLRGPARCRSRGIPCRPRRHAGRRRGLRHGGSQRLAGPAGGRRAGFPLPAAVPREGRRHAEGCLRAAGRHGRDRPRVGGDTQEHDGPGKVGQQAVWRMQSGHALRVGIEGHSSSLEGIFGGGAGPKNPRCAEREIRLKAAICNDVIDMAESNGRAGTRILPPLSGNAGGGSGGAGAAGACRAAGQGVGRAAGAGPDPDCGSKAGGQRGLRGRRGTGRDQDRIQVRLLGRIVRGRRAFGS